MNCEGAEVLIIPTIVDDFSLLNKLKNIPIEFHPKLVGFKNIRRIINLLFPFYDYKPVTRGKLGVDNAIFKKRNEVVRLPFRYTFYLYASYFLDFMFPFIEIIYYKVFRNIFFNNNK